MLRYCLFAAAVFCAAVRVSFADEIIFNNGDHLTGKIGTVEGGKMKITTAVAGEVTVNLSDVKSFKTDAPADIRTTSGQAITGNVVAVQDGQVRLEGGQNVPLADVKKINPPPEKWTGSITVTGALTRGNSHTEDLGVNLAAMLRRQNNQTDDRISLSGGYSYSRERDSQGNNTTTTDNWNALGKYDRFWTPKYYTYGLMKVEHDRIASLDYRLSPGIGLGYQWIESPTLNFFTEAGLSYVYENFSDGNTDEHLAGRLAYHVDKKLNNAVTLFHNLEYLPAFEDPGDYNLNTDAGVRAKLIQAMFAEFRIEYKRDSVPAAGSEKNDLRYTLGLGWQF